MLIARGHFVTVALSGDYGKPRPALVVQASHFSYLDSIVVCPISSHVRGDAGLFRIDIPVRQDFGILNPSQILIDKITAIKKKKIGRLIGQADTAMMLKVNHAIALFLDLSDTR